METVKLKNLPGHQWLNFAVVDASGHVISVHQHPDAAQWFIRNSPRTDLSWIEVEL